MFSWLKLNWTLLDFILLLIFFALLFLAEYRPIRLKVKKRKKISDEKPKKGKPEPLSMLPCLKVEGVNGGDLGDQLNILKEDEGCISKACFAIPNGGNREPMQNREAMTISSLAQWQGTKYNPFLLEAFSVGRKKFLGWAYRICLGNAAAGVTVILDSRGYAGDVSYLEGGDGRLTVSDIPGPKPSLPIFGTRWIFSGFGPYKMNKIHEAYKDMFQKYGKVVKEESLWNFPVISVVDLKSIEEVLNQHSKYPLRPPTEVTVHYRKSRPDRYSNLGLVNEQGETWHQLRGVLTPELTSTKTVMRFLPEQNAVADDFVYLLRTARDEKNEVHSFEEFANRMGLEVTCKLILGRRMGFLNGKVDPLALRLAAAVRAHFCASRDTFYGLPFWKVFPTKTYKSFAESEEIIYEIISDLVEKSLEEESETCQTGEAQGVFSSILKAKGLGNKEKKAAIIDFIAAGIQTLGNTLVFLLYLIAKHKDVQEKLYQEISEIIPRGSSITSEALKRATYLRACITEAFRILPTAPWVARILEKEMNISGYHLKPGLVVICHTWLACLQESNFEFASEFRPERWLGEKPKPSSFLVVPFGSGRRMCPGKRFSEQELQVVLAKIVSEFVLEFDGELQLQFEFLLSPQAPVKLRLIDRE